MANFKIFDHVLFTHVSNSDERDILMTVVEDIDKWAGSQAYRVQFLEGERAGCYGIALEEELTLVKDS